MSDCVGNFGKWFGHDFQPVYDVTPPTRPPLMEFGFEGRLHVFREIAALEMRRDEKLTKRVYVKHVCTRCGAEIHRGDA